MLNRVVTALAVGLFLLSGVGWGRQVLVTGIVTVEDEDGSPLPGVTVDLVSETAGPFTSITGVNGKARFMVPPGHYTATATFEGFASSEGSITLLVGQSNELTLRFGFPVTSESIDVTARWNSWATELDGDDPIPALVKGSTYIVSFDIAGVDYRELLGGGASFSAELDPALSELLDEREDPSVRLLVKAFVQGEGLRLVNESSLAERQSVSKEKLRKVETLLDQWETETDHSIATASDLFAAMHIPVEVEATAVGRALVGLAVWDEKTRQPLDFVIFQATVLPSDSGEGSTSEIQVVGGLRHLRGFPDTPEAAASVSVFESGSAADGSLRNTVIYLGADRFARSWSPRRSIREYVSLDSQFSLTRQLELVQCDADYTQIGKFFSGVLFSDPSQTGREAAQEARAKLKALISQGGHPVVSTLFIDAAGDTQPMPLGMLGLDTHLLGEIATVAQPLPTSRREEETGKGKKCIEYFTTIIPDSLDLGDGCECMDLDELLRPHERPSGPSLKCISDVKDYFDRKTESTAREGLLLVSHHADGFISFQPSFTEAMQAEEMTREFKKGSAAILIGCTVGSLTPLNRSLPLVRTLNEKGIDAMIFSPFTLNATLGSRLAAHFSDALEKIRGDGKTATLQEIYEQVRKSMKQDDLAKPFLRELNGLMLVGSSKISYCPAPFVGPHAPISKPEKRCKCNTGTRIHEWLKGRATRYLGVDESGDPKSGVGPARRAAARRCREAGAQGQSPCSSNPAQK